MKKNKSQKRTALREAAKAYASAVGLDNIHTILIINSVGEQIRVTAAPVISAAILKHSKGN